MSEPSAVIIGLAPDLEGPLVCTLPLDRVAGRLDAFRREVFGHLRSIERPSPARLRLGLAAAEPERVRSLLVQEQACCGFLAFTITPAADGLLVGLEVREDAAGALDGLAWLAEAAR